MFPSSCITCTTFVDNCFGGRSVTIELYGKAEWLSFWCIISMNCFIFAWLTLITPWPNYMYIFTRIHIYVWLPYVAFYTFEWLGSCTWFHVCSQPFRGKKKMKIDRNREKNASLLGGNIKRVISVWKILLLNFVFRCASTQI